MEEMENVQVNDTDSQNKEKFMADVEASLVRIKPGKTLMGKVVQITEDEVCVNIGYKSDGLIKKTDLTDDDIKLDDEIEVEVVKVNDGEGNVILSQRNVVSRRVWAELMKKYEENEYVTAVGKEAVKGGLIATVEGINCFVPASLLSQRFVDKISDYVGQTMKLKIIEADQQKRRIVASRKAVVLEEAAQKKADAWSKLSEGDVVQGTVRRIKDFGVFVDVGGVDGLIHISDLSYKRIKHPSEVISPDQVISVKILSLDSEKDRIQLGYKQLLPRPWDTANIDYPEGNIVTGRIVRTAPFGAFVELEHGLDGLVHISQCAQKRIQKVEDAVSIGDIVKVKVLSVDSEKKRISLSIRDALDEDPGVYDEEQYIAADEVVQPSEALGRTDVPVEGTCDTPSDETVKPLEALGETDVPVEDAFDAPPDEMIVHTEPPVE